MDRPRRASRGVSSEGGYAEGDFLEDLSDPVYREREVRERDGFRDNFKRTAWEAVYDAQAPGPEL